MHVGHRGTSPTARPGLDLDSFSVVHDPVHVHDLDATVLRLVGLQHTRLTVRFQGRDHRLTVVHGRVVRQLLA